MAKMRVHELAKEIDKNNKDVLDVLQANGVNVQSPLSVIDEAQADMVRRAYAPKPEKTEAPAEEKKEEQAVPKKRITAVFRSQNSSQAGRSKGPRPAVPGAARRAQGTRPAGAGQKPGTRPAGPRPVMKAAPEGAETEAKAAGTTQEAPKAAERTQNTQGSRERQNGQRSFDGNRRPGGDRNSQGRPEKL